MESMSGDEMRFREMPNEKMFRSVAAVLRPRSVALVGASDKGAWPRALHANFDRAGFGGNIYFVNPSRREIWGERCYPDLRSLPEPVDHALIVVPADAAIQTVKDGAACGVKSFTIYAAGFGEGEDHSGPSRAKQLSDLVEKTGVRVCGPNCMGFVSTPARLWAYPSRRIINVPSGSVGLIFQSGGTLGYWLTHGVQRGLGFSYAISSGNELDLDLADYINCLVGDDSTRIIACLVEGIRRPTAFLEAARRALNARKPLLIVKVGRTKAAQASSQSHTGALGGDDSVFDAVCCRYGITRCESLDQMMEVALAFHGGRLPVGRRVAIISSSGGAKGLMLDAIAKERLELASFSSATMQTIKGLVDPVSKLENPLDTGAGAANNPKGLSEVCRAILADDGVDLLAFLGRTPLEDGEQQDVESFNAIARSTDKPVFAFSQMSRAPTEVGRRYQAAAGLPFLQGIPQAANAIKAVIAFGERVRRPAPDAPVPPGLAAPQTDVELQDLLAAKGLPPPPYAVVETAEAAAAAATRIGFPVVLKAISPQISHKTEFGAVRLNLRDGGDVASACAALTTRLSAVGSGITLQGFLVQKMISGLEIMLGVREDQQFGPYVVLGLGGIFVEALQDVAVRMLPVTRAQAHDMIWSLRTSQLLGAYRGGNPRDVDALANAILAMTQLFLENRAWLSDLEINPLMVLDQGHGVCAVDVRAIRR